MTTNNTTHKTKSDAKYLAIRTLLVQAGVGEESDAVARKLVGMTPAEVENLFRRVEIVRKD